MNEQKLLRKKQRAINEKNTQQLAQICRKLGDMYGENQKHQDALEQYREEAKAYNNINMRLEAARANRMMGEMYMLLENFDEALKYGLKYLKMAADEKSKTDEQRAYATIGRIYLLQAQSNPLDAEMNKLLKRAEKNFLESLLICKSLTNSTKEEILDMKARLYLNLGVTNECKGEFKEATNYLEKSMTICRHNDFWELLHQCYTTTAILYANKLNDIESALRFLDLAINVAQRLSNNRTERVCQTFLTKAEVLIKTSDIQSAKQVLKKAYKMKTPDAADRESIETTLRIVAAMCYAENTLLSSNTDDSEQRKTQYEKLGDGACKLKNYTAAIGYYLKMLQAAEELNESEKSMAPIYVSLYQTYKDIKQYDEALEFMWKEYELCKETPSEAFSTLFGIADTFQLAKKDFWDTDGIYERARNEAQKLKDKKKERLILKEQIALRKKNGMETLATIMEEDMKIAGLDVSNITESSDSETETESVENTPDIGDGICLDDLSDDSDDEMENAPMATTSAAINQPRTLRKRGVIRVTKNEKGETQLHRACITGNLAQVRRLIDQGHPVNVRDNAGWLPLHEAANHGFRDIVEVLIDNDASINDKGGEYCDGVTPIYDACANGKLEVIEVLLDKGANVTQKTNLGKTPLDSLDEWRKKQILDPTVQSFYETIRGRFVQKLDRAGILVNTSPAKTSPIKSGSRGKSATPRKRILSESSDDETQNLNFDSERIETVDEILQKAFPSDIDSDVENGANDRLNNRSPTTDLNYRRVMEDLRTNNMQNKLPFGPGHFQPVPKIPKRASLLAPDEIDDTEWLDDDIGPIRKKRKTNSNGISGSSESTRTNNSNRNSTNGLIGSGELARSNNTNRNSLSSNSDCGISSTIENYYISDGEDDKIDAFSVLMSSTDSLGRRQRRLGSSSNRASRDNLWRQQTSLLDNGFTRNITESPELAQSSVSSTVTSPYKINNHTFAPTSTAYSVKVKVEENLLNVAIARNLIDDLNIEWLADEAAKRYYNLKGVKPVLRLTTSDGAIYENTDPLTLVFNDNSVVSSTVLEWVTPPLSQRYMEACAQFKCAADSFIQTKLELIASSQMLSITDQILSIGHCRPLFKAIHFQQNLTSIDLTNSFIEDDGVKQLAQALPTLSQLASLNLSSNLITTSGLNHILSTIEFNPNCLTELRELILNYNPLQNQCLSPLSSICSKLPELNLLHLASTELTDLHEHELKFNSLIDLDLSYNDFRSNGLTKAIDKLNACKLQNLNLSFCCMQLNGNDIDFNCLMGNATKSLIEALLNVLNLGTCSNLEEIHLSGCGLNDIDCWRLIQPISRSKVLRHISLKNNAQITKVTFKHLFETLSVKNVYLEGCGLILNGLNENDAECVQRNTHCMENVTISLGNTSIDSNEFTILKRIWNTMSRNRGKIFVRDSKAFLTLKPDNYNKFWGYSLN